MDDTYDRPLLVPAEESIGASFSDRLERLEAVRLLVTDATDLPSIIAAISDNLMARLTLRPSLREDTGQSRTKPLSNPGHNSAPSSPPWA